MRGFWTLAIGVLALTQACDGTDPNGDVTLRNRIVFLSDTGRYAIHHMNPDGTDERAIPVEFPEAAATPSVAPDGRSLLLAVLVSGRSDIFRVGADGSGLTNLTNHPASDHYPEWSPDGTRIAFSSTRINNADLDIMVMNADGSEVEPVSVSPGSDSRPSWAPDGISLVFASDRVQPDNHEVYRGSIESGDFTPITDHLEDDYAAAWSPLGNQIAFLSPRDPPDGVPRPASIYLMSPDGADARAVVSDTINYTNAGPRSPAWSGDGQRLVYNCDSEICVVNADGTGRTEIGTGRDPTWGPP